MAQCIRDQQEDVQALALTAVFVKETRIRG
jgi:hypothetical protein